MENNLTSSSTGFNQKPDSIMARIGRTKDASRDLALLDDAKINSALQSIANNLRRSCGAILRENKKDLMSIDDKDPMYDRLLLSDHRIMATANDIETLTTLASPIGRIIDRRERPNGLYIEKISVPLGVVAVIYESRPNVTIDVFTLCFKSGNACILKGGREACHSNQILVDIIKSALDEQGINSDILYLLPPDVYDRGAMYELLGATGLIDVCIPRGGKALINFVRKNAKIPVIETGAGIVHTYFDKSGEVEKGRLIIENAKTRRVSVCNALDTLIIHKDRLEDLWTIVEPLSGKSVEIFADEESYKILMSLYPARLIHLAKPEDFGREFLSYKMSVRTVDTAAEAVEHIARHTSGHSEAIIAEDEEVISYFLARVDAAAVYVNASTAFTDGGEFGMGAEIGISTQELHARGPMALEALTSYKWIVFGNGHIRT